MRTSGELGPDDERTGTGGLHEDVVSGLEARLKAEQAKNRLPTLAVGLVRDGVLVWSGAGGATGVTGGDPPTASTQYRIGSISKTFAAVSVMRLRDAGLLDLGDAIGAHVRELVELPVTIAQLLSHTSGLRAETNGPWWERTPGVPFLDLVASSARPIDLLCRPGRRFHYSNVGYAILGELIARKRAVPFGEVVKDELLGPLGMERTTLRPDPPHAHGFAVHPHADALLAEPEHDAVAMAPAGQLSSTIEDLARWSSVLAGRRPDVLGSESIGEMTEPIGITDLPDQPWTAGYGLGLQLWNQGGQRRYGHSGSMPGFIAMLLLDHATKDTVVALTNSTGGFGPSFCEELLAYVSSQQPRPPVAFRPNLAGFDERAIELCGCWYWGPREYRMSLGAGGRLDLAAIPHGRDASFAPIGDGTYVGEWGYFAGERLEPRWRSNGSLSHLDIASFAFTRFPYDPAADIPGGVDARGWRDA